MPRWTCASVTPVSSLGPSVPTPSPSTTDAPLATAMEPRWVRVTDQPSAVSIVTHLPLPGTTPANETTPAAGARTAAPSEPATSTPRWKPGAFGSSGSKEYGWTTGPSAGQVQAPAGATTASA